MKQLRNCIPALGILAILSLFLTMPETPDFFGMFKCKTCEARSPYLPMLGASYFAILVSISLLFSTFSNALIARGGLIWAILLALKMTYFDLPHWCAACLIGHACHILMWALWLIPPRAGHVFLTNIPVKGRLFLALFAPIVVVALFSSLNLTFLVYTGRDSKIGRCQGDALNLSQAKPTPKQINLKSLSMQAGLKCSGCSTSAEPIFESREVYNLKSKQKMLVTSDAIVPAFTVQNKDRAFSNADIVGTKGAIINFVSPHCSYCQEQLPILDVVAAQINDRTFRIINISPSLPVELMQLSPSSEWFEDRDGALRELFKVDGFPTLFVVGNDTKILQIIPGVPQELKSTLLMIFSERF